MTNCTIVYETPAGIATVDLTMTRFSFSSGLIRFYYTKREPYFTTERKWFKKASVPKVKSTDLLVFMVPQNKLISITTHYLDEFKTKVEKDEKTS